MDEEKQQSESYLREIEHIPPLAEEEVRHLIESRVAALQQVAQAHLHLVVPIAKEYTGQGRELVGLIQRGNIGLLRAVETFDTTTREPFGTYAVRSIRAAIAQDQIDGHTKHL